MLMNLKVIFKRMAMVLIISLSKRTYYSHRMLGTCSKVFLKKHSDNKANASHVMVLIQKLYDVERATLLKLDPVGRKPTIRRIHPIFE